MHDSGCRFTLSNRLSRRWRFFCWRSTTTKARTTITTCWYDDGCCAIPGAALHQKKEDHKNPQSKRSDLLSLNAKYHPLQQTESVRKHFLVTSNHWPERKRYGQNPSGLSIQQVVSTPWLENMFSNEFASSRSLTWLARKQMRQNTRAKRNGRQRRGRTW